MTRQSPNDAMNRVMNALKCSVASYSQFRQFSAGPAADALWQLASCHLNHVRRIGELLSRRHWHVSSRAFPMAFRALNDLSLEQLLPWIIEDGRQIIGLVEASAIALKSDSEANELAAEVVDSEKRHLQTLQLALDHCSITSDMSVRTKRQRSVWPIANSRLVLRNLSVGQAISELLPSVRGP